VELSGITVIFEWCDTRGPRRVTRASAGAPRRRLGRDPDRNAYGFSIASPRPSGMPSCSVVQHVGCQLSAPKMHQLSLNRQRDRRTSHGPLEASWGACDDLCARESIKPHRTPCTPLPGAEDTANKEERSGRGDSARDRVGRPSVPLEHVQ